MNIIYGRNFGWFLTMYNEIPNKIPKDKIIFCSEFPPDKEFNNSKFIKRKTIEWNCLDGSYEHLYESLKAYNYIEKLNDVLENDSIFIFDDDEETIALLEYMYKYKDKLKYKPDTVIIMRMIFKQTVSKTKQRERIISLMPKLFNHVVDIKKLIKPKYDSLGKQYSEIDMPIILKAIEKKLK